MSNPYDREAALRVTGGSAELADHLWGLFMEELPERLRLLEIYAKEENISELRKLVHNLSASAAYCCTPSLQAELNKLTQALNDPAYDSYANPIAAVQREIGRIFALGMNNL